MLASRMCSLLIYVLNLIFDIDIDIDIEYEQQHAEKKAASISQLATLNRFNVL